MAKILLLIIFFLLLGKSADFAIRGIKSLGRRLGVPSLLSGLALGLFTSTPEFFIGINSAFTHIPVVSFGNTLGGVLVLFGLISGFSIILSRRIEVKLIYFKSWEMVAAILFLLLPLLFVFDGSVSRAEGLLLIISYLALIVLIFDKGVSRHNLHLGRLFYHKKLLVFIVLGLAGVLVFSRFIVFMAYDIARKYEIPLFLMGVIVFSLGTNLPELAVSLRSLRNNIKELSFGTIVGSALANVFIIGVVSTIRPIFVAVDMRFLVFSLFFFVMCFLFLIFAMTKGRFTRKEGFVLLSCYALFVIFETAMSFT